MKTICDERTFEVEFESRKKASVTIRKDYRKQEWVCRIWIIKGDDILIKMDDVIFNGECYPFNATSSDDIFITIVQMLRAFD